MEVSQLLSLLPESTLSELALLTNADRYAKKLQGELVFKLLLHCILSYKDNSLRTMESAYGSIAFRLFNTDLKNKRIRFSSISARLSTIGPAYFEQLYNICPERYGDLLGPSRPSLIRFDSTIVALPGKLLRVGYQLKGGDGEHLRQLKSTVGLSKLPVAVHFFTEQSHTSENRALKEALLAFRPSQSGIVRVFDRGITSRSTYDELTRENMPFVSRLSPGSKYEIHTDNRLPGPVQTPTLVIYSDSMVYLFGDKCIKASYPVRCIRASRREDGREIIFVTNINDLGATDITLLYRHRWDIEVFFKFLKQELNFGHLINRSENGIKVVLYTTMIAAILLLTYKELNGLRGYRTMKQRFINELQKSLMKDFIVLCGGDPDKVDNLLKPHPV